MCVDGVIFDSRIWNNYETNIIFIFFLCEFKIKTSVMHEHCDEQPKTCEEHIRTF